MGDAGLWKAPGSGTPATPAEVASPDPERIADIIARRLTVPRGPVRTIAITLGLIGVTGNPTPPTISGTALNSTISQLILGAPGLITHIDFTAAIVTTGAAAGILQLFDHDTSMPLIRQFVVNVGAAGSYNIIASSTPDDLPFLNGLVLLWTPIVAAFGNSLINLNVDYNSIPIGQRVGNG